VAASSLPNSPFSSIIMFEDENLSLLLFESDIGPNSLDVKSFETESFFYL